MAGGAPRGECEEYRTWTAERVLRWLTADDETHDCEVISEDRLLGPCVLEVENNID
jgi:hypothetical protein